MAKIPSEAGFVIMLAKLPFEHSPLAVCVLDVLSSTDMSVVLASYCMFLRHVSSEPFINGSPLSAEYWLIVCMAAENQKITEYIINYS